MEVLMEKYSFICLSNWILLFEQWSWENTEDGISKGGILSKFMGVSY
jgi:hypothetical protein